MDEIGGVVLELWVLFLAGNSILSYLLIAAFVRRIRHGQSLLMSDGRIEFLRRVAADRSSEHCSPASAKTVEEFHRSALDSQP